MSVRRSIEDNATRSEAQISILLPNLVIIVDMLETPDSQRNFEGNGSRVLTAISAVEDIQLSILTKSKQVMIHCQNSS